MYKFLSITAVAVMSVLSAANAEQWYMVTPSGKCRLGSEVDATLNYGLNKITNIELGASLMAASHSMEYAKGIAPDAARLTASWAYLQVNIRPDFFSK